MRGSFAWLLSVLLLSGTEALQLEDEGGILSLYRSLQQKCFGKRTEEEMTALLQYTGENNCLWGSPEPAIPLPPSSRSCPKAAPAEIDLPAYIITLSGNKGRVGNAQCIITALSGQSTDKARVSASMFPAIESKSLNLNQLLQSGQLRSKGDMKLGEIAVYLSHVAIWRKVVEDGMSSAVIFEDDASITVDLVDRLRQPYAELPENWDIMWLFESPSVRLNSLNRPPIPFDCCNTLLKKGHGIGLDGYVISQRGAKKLLSLASPIDRFPIDLRLHHLIGTGELNAYLVNPQLVYDDFHMKSEIQNRYYTELFGMSKPNKNGLHAKVLTPTKAVDTPPSSPMSQAADSVVDAVKTVSEPAVTAVKGMINKVTKATASTSTSSQSTPKASAKMVTIGPMKSGASAPTQKDEDPKARVDTTAVDVKAKPFATKAKYAGGRPVSTPPKMPSVPTTVKMDKVSTAPTLGTGTPPQPAEEAPKAAEKEEQKGGRHLKYAPEHEDKGAAKGDGVVVVTPSRSKLVVKGRTLTSGKK